MRMLRGVIVGVVVTLAVAGCAGSDAEPAGSPASQADLSKVAEAWVTAQGGVTGGSTSGGGDGSAAFQLPVADGPIGMVALCTGADGAMTVNIPDAGYAHDVPCHAEGIEPVNTVVDAADLKDPGFAEMRDVPDGARWSFAAYTTADATDAEPKITGELLAAMFLAFDDDGVVSHGEESGGVAEGSVGIGEADSALSVTLLCGGADGAASVVLGGADAGQKLQCSGGPVIGGDPLTLTGQLKAGMVGYEIRDLPAGAVWAIRVTVDE